MTATHQRCDAALQDLLVKALLELKHEQAQQSAALMQKHEHQVQLLLQQLHQEQAKQVTALQREHELQRNALLATCLSSLIDPNDTAAVRELESSLLRILQNDQAMADHSSAHGPRRRAPQPQQPAPSAAPAGAAPTAMSSSSAASTGQAESSSCSGKYFVATPVQQCAVPLMQAPVVAQQVSHPAPQTAGAPPASAASAPVPAAADTRPVPEEPSAKRTRLEKVEVPSNLPLPPLVAPSPPRWEALITAAKSELVKNPAPAGAGVTTRRAANAPLACSS